MQSTRRLKVATTLLLSLFTVLTGESKEIAPAQVEFFESKIRPVLAQECYECHSSTGKSKGGLILDFRDGLLEGGDTGPAIEPGNAAGSLLIEALKHEFDLEMPKAGVKLDAPIIADFERWINMGAPDPRNHPPTEEELLKDTNWEAIFKTRQNWWSFQPVKSPEIPEGAGSNIDRFIRSRLKEEGLSPSLPADARTLARRLHYTITGLPPTPEELDAFEKDYSKNPDATSLLIDSLLASPRFGERWARHWMDWVRYAESHGSEGDPRIPNAYHYRDYLIRALNDDVSYDQLLTEHIAGDLIENPRFHKESDFNESILGTIHWRMVFHGFAPTDALDEKVRFTDDQINVFTKAFQGLTVSCARCHDHKFDAISQADYYALFGILGSTRPGMRLIDSAEELERNKAHLTELKPRIRTAIAESWLAEANKISQLILKKKGEHAKAKKADDLYYLFSELSKKAPFQNAMAALKRSWQPQDLKATHQWDLADPVVYQSWYRYGNGLPAESLPAGSFKMAVAPDKKVIEAILPAGVYSGLLSDKHAARLTSKDFDLEGDDLLYINAIGNGSSRSRYVVQNYPRNGTVFKVNNIAVKGGSGTPWQWLRQDLTFWEGDSIHIEMSTAKDSALLVANNDRSWFGIRQAMLVKKGGGDPARIYIGEHLKPVVEAIGETPPTTPEELAGYYQVAIQTAIKDWAKGNLSDAQAVLLDRAIRNNLLTNSLESIGPEAKALITKYRELEGAIKAPTRVPGLDEWTAADQPLFERGNHKKPLEPVSRRFIETVDSTPYQTEQSGRLEMVDDLLRQDNTFTRRVIVNRIWTHLFGNGIVGSVDNFGRLGEKPSHPELLDYLASSFDTKYQWSIKSLIKEIVSSATWQQSSKASEAAKNKDPENRLLSHFPIRRLEAEAIRDKLIALSGKLDTRMYGPGANGGTSRRSVYVDVIRNRLDPFLSVFDAPIPFSTTGKRPVTNVPAQSLTMLNDRQIVSRATDFAARFREGTDRERVIAMWSHALGRSPKEEEITSSLSFMSRLRSASDEVASELEQLRARLSKLQSANNAILAPARAKLEAETGTDKPVNPSDSGAIAAWDFEGGTTDTINGLGGKLTGKAVIKNGELHLDGNSSFFSNPLPRDLSDKTLEVVVTLNQLNQRAGGALTIQDLNGHIFDSIVFAEKNPNEWMAGSNNFKRTRDFGGNRETEADKGPVHIAITYRADGTITGYRNGSPYGKPYKSETPVRFRKGQSQIVMGLRHGTQNARGRNLACVIHEARIYDTALDGDTIASLAAGKNIISTRAVIKSLSDKDRKTIEENESQIASLSKQLGALEKEGSGVGDTTVWQSFAHSLFNLKEFIYVH